MSTETESLKAAFLKSSRSAEVLGRFGKMSNWIEDSGEALATQAMLGAHARRYFSPFPAAYLFLAKPESLLQYSPLIARDGALTLLLFFLEHPEPFDSNLKLFIDPAFGWMVPRPWREQIYTYRLKSKKGRPEKTKKNFLFILTNMGPRHCKPEFVAETIAKIKNQPGSEDFCYHCVTAFSESQEAGFVLDEMNRYQNDLLLDVAQHLGQKPKVHTLKDLEGSNLEDWYYCDLNQHKFYYSDSYYYHLLLSKGAQPFSAEQNVEESSIIDIPLSFYHEISISPLALADSESNRIDEALQDFKSSVILRREIKKYKPHSYGFQSKLCTPSFENFAYSFFK